MASQAVPSFSSLPLDPKGPPGNAWGRFGPTDELGMLNLLTPAVVAEAAKEIRSGERISLDLPLDHFKCPFWGRPPFKQDFTHMDYHINDDSLSFNTQSSTQWDGLRHYGTATLPSLDSVRTDMGSSYRRRRILPRPDPRGPGEFWRSRDRPVGAEGRHHRPSCLPRLG